MRTTRTLKFEEEVLGCVEADPSTSTRRIAREMGSDIAPRIAVCQWLLQQWIADQITSTHGYS